jgi:drug/metabolite transporter (DMT)-like permease
MNTTAIAAWAIVCIVWGTTYLGIRIALETIPPMLMASFRWIAAGTLMLATFTIRRERLPPPSHFGSLAILGVLLLGFGNGGIVWAEQTVPSGLTAVLAATSPFWMVGIDAFMPDGDRLSVRRAVGLVVGFSGIVLLVWPELQSGVSGRAFLEGVMSAQLACVGWAIGSTYARRHARSENVLGSAAYQMLFGGMFLLAIGLLRGEWATLRFTPRTAGALAYLTVFGAVVAFSAYAYALKHLPVAFVSLYAYINPVIAVALGTLVLAEAFTARTVVSAAIVLVGVWAVSAPAPRPGAVRSRASLHDAPAGDDAH